MYEISGNISVTFKVKDASDLERINDLCRQYEGVKVANAVKPSRKKTETSTETNQNIIQLLKATFHKDGFTMKDAAALTLEKLDKRKHTVANAIVWAKNQGIILRKGQGYYFTDLIREKVAAKLEANPIPTPADKAPPIPN